MADLIGYFGVGLILLAYFLNLYNRLDNNSRLYMWINLIGAGLACVSSVLIMSLLAKRGEASTVRSALMSSWLN